MPGNTGRDENVAAGTWPLGLKALGRLHIGRQIPISRAKSLQTGDTSGVVWNWHKWARRREERLEGKWEKHLLHISLSFPSAVCCCCELLNSCSALSQKGLCSSGDGEWSLQLSALGAALNGRGCRSNVSLIDYSTKYTWEFSTWGSSQRCCSGSSDLKLLAGSGYCWVLLTHSCRSRRVPLISCLPSNS